MADAASIRADAGSVGHEREFHRTHTPRPGKPSTPDKDRVIQLAAASRAVGEVDSDRLAVEESPKSAKTAKPDSPGTQVINLTTALLLTSGENPQIAFAQARIEEALAQCDRAEALWLPSIRAGVNFNTHDGRIQDVVGSVIETRRGSYYAGLGANAVGAGSPAVPGLLASFHLADAVFQPRIAEQTACARKSGAQAASNDALLQTALAYLALLRAEQDLSISQETVDRAQELARVTGEYARTGQGLESDADRAQAELSLRKTEIHRSEESVAVASARLAEQIRWSAGEKLVPAEPRLVPVELIPADAEPQGLVAQALMTRPEVSESRYLVGEAVERLQRERYAPLVPSVLLGLSYGGMAGGVRDNLNHFGDRLDADAVAYWEVRNLGLGESAVQREANSRIDQARLKEVMVLDRVAREVVEAHAQVASRREQIVSAREGVASARRSFDRNWQRIQAGQGLPIETLQSLQALAAAQRELLRTVVEYNTAQFTLHRALGWPISAPVDVEG